jgi:hypothetical protein
MMKFVCALAILLTAAWPAAAQHSHGDKGPKGGMMEDVAGVHAELLTSGNTITINVYDEGGKPIDTKAFSGSVLVVSGAARETVQLQPAGPNLLKGDAKNAVGSAAAITLMIKTAAGKTGQARFKR